MASRVGPGSALGPVFTTRLVTADVEELYDYEVLRTLAEPTMFVVRLAAPTIGLGGSQSPEVLSPTASSVGLRRRRGGGGAVLLRPDDVWVDWWIPRDDPRWAFDVHAGSQLAGRWWESTLREVGVNAVRHEGRVVDDPTLRVACFSGRGPGELFVDDRKLVGVTQWRVRDGFFVSTVLHTTESSELATFIADPAPTLAQTLTHHSLHSLELDGDQIIDSLRLTSAPATYRQLYLLP